MSEQVVIACITNGTVIAVALIQAWRHKKHEDVSEDTNREVKEHNRSCPGHGNGSGTERSG